MELVVVGFVVGVALAAMVVARRARGRGSVVAFRPASAQPSQPYRGEAMPAAEPSLTELAAAATKAGLEVRSRRDGLELRRGGKWLRLRVADPARVGLASIDLADTDLETLGFELALALVPLYGPIQVREAHWGTFVVDGRRDASALREQRGERIKAMARGVADRIAASKPMWEELARKQR